ncbi:MAG TPA: hypothetical protein DCX61_01475, partial [Gemmatimonadetes bacterium]|nr:hypothetical protein [Gemmatimonadota bacterium]
RQHEYVGQRERGISRFVGNFYAIYSHTYLTLLFGLHFLTSAERLQGTYVSSALKLLVPVSVPVDPMGKVLKTDDRLSCGAVR